MRKMKQIYTYTQCNEQNYICHLLNEMLNAFTKKKQDLVSRSYIFNTEIMANLQFRGHGISKFVILHTESLQTLIIGLFCSRPKKYLKLFI